jgi:phosphopentomutase
MAELSKGKDTTTGHWELSGIITSTPFPLYPHGFPPEIIRPFEESIGRDILGNSVASGTEIIERLGAEHLRTGKPIVYTSADSVFQIAAHENVVPIGELYRWCEIARGILTGPHAVARVIARPFVGEHGDFTRTPRRKDFSLSPPEETLLDIVKDSCKEVIAIGKIEDIFAGRGVTTSVHPTDNAAVTVETIRAAESGRGALIFSNLVDFDMRYGHRNDPQGYANALQEFDADLPRLLNALKPTDMLIITADHGCDPTTPSTDHTREYVPLLVTGPGLKSGVDLGVRQTFADVAATVAEWLDLRMPKVGQSFLPDVQ